MGAPSLEVDAMEEGITLATLDSHDCPVESRMASFLSSEGSPGIKISLTKADSLEMALEN